MTLFGGILAVGLLVVVVVVTVCEGGVVEGVLSRV